MLTRFKSPKGLCRLVDGGLDILCPTFCTISFDLSASLVLWSPPSRYYPFLPCFIIPSSFWLNLLQILTHCINILLFLQAKQIDCIMLVWARWTCQHNAKFSYCIGNFLQFYVFWLLLSCSWPISEFGSLVSAFQIIPIPSLFHHSFIILVKFASNTDTVYLYIIIFMGQMHRLYRFGVDKMDTTTRCKVFKLHRKFPAILRILVFIKLQWMNEWPYTVKYMYSTVYF